MSVWHVVDLEWRSLGFLKLNWDEDRRKRHAVVHLALPPNIEAARAAQRLDAAADVVTMNRVTLKWETMSMRRPNSDAVWTMQVLQTATAEDAKLIFRLRPEDFQTMCERYGSPSPATKSQPI